MRLAAAGAVAGLAGCTSRRPGLPLASPRLAVAGDYSWFALDRDLRRGFCFTWVRDLTPAEVLDRLDGEELQQVTWQQLVGSGDGQRGAAGRYFIGVARADDWSLIVEDRGDLGATDAVVLPLSRGTRLISHQRGEDGHGRFLVVEDGVIQLDFDPAAPGKISGVRSAELKPTIDAVGFDTGDDPAVAIEAAFALAARFTEIPMTQDLLRTRTYLLTAVSPGG
ncbi:hypothetical protein Ari01nite_38860 [Paractinoplanes rishiriensis]|uniref:Lipoprotein n=1 Tax=Paractinoplanes rishiriensis TaxID=1050105 RepID=A0A919JWD0_9ACTN|nr:hypothetical protein Ari01nite_38860 [Actinoplanes rishiriensis]